MTTAKKGPAPRLIDRRAVADTSNAVHIWSDKPSSVGAIYTWLGTGKDPFPEWTRLHKCPRCLSLVLADDVEAHVRWHRGSGA